MVVEDLEEPPKSLPTRRFPYLSSNESHTPFVTAGQAPGPCKSPCSRNTTESVIRSCLEGKEGAAIARFFPKCKSNSCARAGRTSQRLPDARSRRAPAQCDPSGSRGGRRKRPGEERNAGAGARMWAGRVRSGLPRSGLPPWNPFLFLAILCLGMASDAPTLNHTLDVQWEEWKTKHNKIYSKNEEGKRRAVWEENLKMIELHNEEYRQGKHGFSMGPDP
ncbi:uncharacterized protein [Castor canadensis]|uniref:Uncharacterized protein n=1 Tax=Castor canadensis TaxID=51338 RepID=A0AC58KTT5_CASCN